MAALPRSEQPALSTGAARRLAESPAGRARERHETSFAGHDGLLHSLLRFSYDGIVITGAEDESILDCSESLCELTGCDRDQLLGRTPLELFEPSARAAAVDIARRHGTTGGRETRRRRHDGGFVGSSSRFRRSAAESVCSRSCTT